MNSFWSLVCWTVKYDLNDSRKHGKLNTMNNCATVFVFFTVLINIFITALGFEGYSIRWAATPPRRDAGATGVLWTMPWPLTLTLPSQVHASDVNSRSPSSRDSQWHQHHQRPLVTPPVTLLLTTEAAALCCGEEDSVHHWTDSVLHWPPVAAADLQWCWRHSGKCSLEWCRHTDTHELYDGLSLVEKATSTVRSWRCFIRNSCLLTRTGLLFLPDQHTLTSVQFCYNCQVPSGSDADPWPLTSWTQAQKCIICNASTH